ncbi:TPA: cell surface protein, partial [Streptococcus equi subsp. equi]|nr:cell surface protein [Streptococcus equi subsp. equi]
MINKRKKKLIYRYGVCSAAVILAALASLGTCKEAKALSGPPGYPLTRDFSRNFLEENTAKYLDQLREHLQHRFSELESLTRKLEKEGGTRGPAGPPGPAGPKGERGE